MPQSSRPQFRNMNTLVYNRRITSTPEEIIKPKATPTRVDACDSLSRSRPDIVAGGKSLKSMRGVVWLPKYWNEGETAVFDRRGVRKQEWFTTCERLLHLYRQEVRMDTRAVIQAVRSIRRPCSFGTVTGQDRTGKDRGEPIARDGLQIMDFRRAQSTRRPPHREADTGRLTPQKDGCMLRSSPLLG